MTRRHRRLVVAALAAAGMLLAAAPILAGAPGIAGAAERGCVGGCESFEASCVGLAEEKLGAVRPACAGDSRARRRCRKAAKRTFRANAKQCKRFARKACRSCCATGSMPQCAPSAGYPLPADPQEPGDPVRGRDLLLNGSYMTCGIPAKLWGLGFGQVIAGGFGGSAEAPRIPDRDAGNAALPYFLNVFEADNGARVINANCLMCHGGVFDGELVVGLGNATADFTRGAGGGAAGLPLTEELLDLLGLDAAEKEQMRRITRRGAVLEPLTRMRTVGMNPAELFAVILMVHHDRETLAWSDEEVTPPTSTRRRSAGPTSR